MLARMLMIGLADAGHEIARQAATADWDRIEPGSQERIEEMPVLRARDVELVLQIGSPASCRAFPVPTLIYTQNALGDLPDSWIEALHRADGVIVPGEFDRRVFSRYFDRVYVAQQSSSKKLFGPSPRYRKEGSKRFTFMFVGSYSFRKGVDVLLPAFLREFGADEDVELLLWCAGSGQGEAFNHLLSQIQRINPLSHVRLNTGSLSPGWMRRQYNRVDCVVTLSRGEGWCMPMTEALLCEVPVIAPRSTAMGEYLDDEVAHMVEVEERAIDGIDDRFGVGFVRQYGKPGNVCYEPDLDGARKALRAVYVDPDEARRRARLGAQRIRQDVSWENAVTSVGAACDDLLAGLARAAEGDAEVRSGEGLS